MNSLSNRSPLQSHSLPSFTRQNPSSSQSHSDSNRGETSLFEELLTINLEKKMREKVEQGKLIKGGERIGLGGLKPGRELFIWSIINRCSVRDRARGGSGRKKGATITWKEESGLNRQQRQQQHKSSQSSIESLREGEADDDDDDEPLAKKLQQAIEKREKQLIRIKAERAKKSLEQQQQPTEVVKIKLPTCPKPVFLKPMSDPLPSTSERPPPALELGPPLFTIAQGSPLDDFGNGGNGKQRSKRLKKNPSSTSSVQFSPGGPPPRPLQVPPFLSFRSLSLPTLPPRIATPTTTITGSFSPASSQGGLSIDYTTPSPSPVLMRSKSENIPLHRHGTGENYAKLSSRSRSRKISIGMKRTRT
jgi:hypothetical protein